jgi:hypothetical protein
MASVLLLAVFDLRSKDVVLWKEIENEALAVYFSCDCTE